MKVIIYIILIFLFGAFSSNAYYIDTLKSLVNRITKDSKTDNEKAWAVYDWITNNIRYDYARMGLFIELEGKINDRPIDSILLYKKGICSEFAALTKVMFELVQIKCKSITGFAKSVEEDLVNFNTITNSHGWNVIYLNGKWEFLDCTWGSTLRAINSNDSSWFLTPPEEFIFTHYPDEKQWTLINREISIEEFINYPLVTDYFRYIKSLPPGKGVFCTSEDYLNISNLDLVEIKDSIDFQLENKNTGDLLTPNTLISRDSTGNPFIKIQLPNKGQFYFRIFRRCKVDYNFDELKKMITFLIERK